MLLYYRRFLLKFSQKSYLLFFFLTKNSKIKTMYISKKTIHFKELVAILYWVFAQFLSKLHLLFFFIMSKFSHFSLFFDTKNKKRRCAPLEKTIHFVKIIAVLFRVFAQFFSEILAFVLFYYMSKFSPFDDVPRIKNVTFFLKLSLYYSGFLLTFSLKSHLLFFF